MCTGFITLLEKFACKYLKIISIKTLIWQIPIGTIHINKAHLGPQLFWRCKGIFRPKGLGNAGLKTQDLFLGLGWTQTSWKLVTTRDLEQLGILLEGRAGEAGRLPSIYHGLLARKGERKFSYLFKERRLYPGEETWPIDGDESSSSLLF